jgi:protein ImuA
MPIATPVLERLRQQIDTLEHRHTATVPVAKAVNQWLPQRGLPAGCIHEVKGAHLSNAIAFAGLLSARLASSQEGQVLYLATDRRLHPLGLLSYGLKPRQILHVSARRQQDLAWVALEALRCAQVSAVIALIDGIDLKDSRRLQLAAEDSGATGFFLGHATSAPIASPVTRWRIAPYVSGDRQRRFDQPCWKVDLLYCRGGRPGSWTLEWRGQDQTLSEVVQPQPMQAAGSQKTAAAYALAG